MSDSGPLFGGLLARCDTVRDATHVGIPRGAAPRFAVPLDNSIGAVALRLLVPPASRARLAMQRAAARLTGRTPLWFVPTPRLEAVAMLAKRNLARCTVSAGTPGPYNKPSVLFLANGNAPASIAKVAVSPASRALVANEAAWLERLEEGNVLTGQRPIALAKGETSDALVLVQSACAGEFADVMFGPDHLRFLASLRAVDRGPSGYPESPMRAAMHRRLVAYRAALDVGWIRRLDDGLARLDDTLGSAGPPMVAAHRDFAPWNIRRAPDGIYVFDWEYAERGYVPLYDAFHHLLMPRALKGGVGPGHAARALSRLRQCAADKVISDDLLVACDAQLFAYLIDISLYYIESCAAQDMQARIFVEYGRLIDGYDEWRLRG